MASQLTTLVLDVGSGFTKAGLAIDDYQCVIEPTLIGRGLGDDLGNLSYGGNALRRKEYLKISSPMKNGVIDDMSEMERYYDYLYTKKLKMKPQNFTLLNGYSIDETYQNKQKIIELFFEKFQVPAYFGVENYLLALYGHGVRNGVVIDCGYDSSSAVCIRDGSILPYSIKKMDIGGKDITERLKELVRQKAKPNTPKKVGEKVNQLTWDNLRKSKEKKCFIANNYVETQVEFAASDKHQVEYELPDSSKLFLNEEMFEAPEILFKPYLSEKKSNSPGIHELVYESLQEVRNEERRMIGGNICLAGGTGDTNNLKKRLQVELKRILAPSLLPELIEVDYKKQSVNWTGGTIVSALTTFQQQWIDKDTYEEIGSSIVFRKCF